MQCLNNKYMHYVWHLIYKVNPIGQWGKILVIVMVFVDTLGHFLLTIIIRFLNYLKYSHLTWVSTSEIVTRAHKYFGNDFVPSCTKEHGLAFIIAYNWHWNLKDKKRLYKIFIEISLKLVFSLGVESEPPFCAWLIQAC